MAGAARIVSLDVVNNRVAVAPMEPRAALAEHDPAEGRFTLHVCSQGAHKLARPLAAALGVPLEAVRVLTGDVGGAFGMKNFLFPRICAGSGGRTPPAPPRQMDG